MRKAEILLFFCLIFCVSRLSALTPPAKGVTVPESFFRLAGKLNAEYRKMAAGKTSAATLLGAAVQPGMKVPVILAGFSDRAGRIGRQTFQDKLFGVNPTGSMSDYYAQASGGRFALDGQVLGWFTARDSLAGYLSGGALGETALFPDSPEGFVVHAILAADSTVDFSLYDNDGPDGVPDSGDDDGAVDALIVIHAGGDAAAGAANFWSHTAWLGGYSVETNDRSASGGYIRITRYSLCPELEGTGGSSSPASGIGVICHEFAHQLGLVDLYDTSAGPNSAADPGSAGIGIWGLMGHGAYGADGAGTDKPVLPCAYSLARLGWLDREYLVGNAVKEIAPLAQERKAYIARYDSLGFEYFLLAYRTKTGFDSELPGEGLMIWHIDEQVADNSDPTHKAVDLEEADGRADLDEAANLGDSDDPWPGTSGRTGFSTLTDPSSARYDNSPSGVSVTNIRLEAGKLKFDFNMDVSSGVMVLSDDDSPPQPSGYGYGDNIGWGAREFIAPKAGVLTAVSTYFLYDNMEYILEIYSGQDNGEMRCPVSEVRGEAAVSGWRTLGLDEEVYFAAGDTFVVALGYISKGFDETSPIPYDRSGYAGALNFVDLQGLGRFDPFGYDLSLRALLDTLKSSESALRVEPRIRFSATALELEKCYAGETYFVPLKILNDGAAAEIFGQLTLSQGSFRAFAEPDSLGCGEILDPDIRFSPGAPGEYAASVSLEAPAGGDFSLGAEISAQVVGYSVRGDSMDIPGKLRSNADSARAGLSLKMPGDGLITGIRTYLHQPFSRVRWRLWSRIDPYSGVPRVKIAESETDTLVAGPGWIQHFFDTPALADSGVDLVAEVEFISAGTEIYVPADTLRENSTIVQGLINLSGRNSLSVSAYPVAVHPLIEPAENADDYPTIALIRPEPEVRTPVPLEGLVAGETSETGIWLVNKGTAAFTADISSDDSLRLFIFTDRRTVQAGDSIFLKMEYTPDYIGSDTVAINILTDSDRAPVLSTTLVCTTDRYVLSYDESGPSATAGFGGEMAWVAVVFTAERSCVLDAARIYCPRAPMTVSGYAVRGTPDVTVPPDTLAYFAETEFTSLGWQALSLDSNTVNLGPGDSVTLELRLISNAANDSNFPVSLDTRGENSGRSFARGSLESAWENLAFDLNLRAVLRVNAGEEVFYRITGIALAEDSSSLAGVKFKLTGVEKDSILAVSDENGEFSFDHLVPGDYELIPQLEGYEFEPDRVGVNIDREDIAGLVFAGLRVVAGDLNGDRRADIFDLLELLGVLSGAAQPGGRSDIDSSGGTDIFDLLRLLQILSAELI